MFDRTNADKAAKLGSRVSCMASAGVPPTETNSGTRAGQGLLEGCHSHRRIWSMAICLAITRSWFDEPVWPVRRLSRLTHAERFYARQLTEKCWRVVNNTSLLQSGLVSKEFVITAGILSDIPAIRFIGLGALTETCAGYSTVARRDRNRAEEKPELRHTPSLPCMPVRSR
jgi:hypothetical protein